MSSTLLRLRRVRGDWRQVGVSRGQGRKQDETVGGEAQDARGVGGRNAGGRPRLEEGQGSGGSRGGRVPSSRSTGSGGKSFYICVARRSRARGARLPRRRVAHSIARVMNYRGKHFRELLDGPGWWVASAPRSPERSVAVKGQWA